MARFAVDLASLSVHKRVTRLEAQPPIIACSIAV